MKRFYVLFVLAIIFLMVIGGCSKRQESPTAPQKEEPKPEGLFGTVKVVTIPDSAVVIFDGKNFGPSPVQIDSLAPAPYKYKILSPDSAHADSGEAFYEVKVGQNNLMVQLKKIGANPVDTVVVVHDTTIIDTVTVIRDTTITDTLIVVEPPDTTYGWLVVNCNETTDSAYVWVNGYLAGQITSPDFRYDSLMIGWHDLKISKKGYQDFSTIFLIESNKPTKFDPTLVAIKTPAEPDSGAISISSHPSGAWFFVANAKADTIARGTTPENGADVIPVPIGEYSVRVGKAGYKTHAPDKIQIQYSGHIVEVNPWLIADDPDPVPDPTPVTSKKVVSWDASPESATLKFDGIFYSLHENYVEVDSGSVHRLQVSADNYFDYDSTFVVNQNVHFEIVLVQDEPPTPPECWKTKSDGDWLYFSANVTELGWEKVKFDASVCNLAEVKFTEMQIEGDWYKYYLNNLPCADYGRLTLVDESGHWFDKDSDCHPELIFGVAFETNLSHKNWFTFNWNGRQNPEPPPTKGTFKLTVTTQNTTVKLNDQLWDDNGEWELDPKEYRLVVSKTGFNTHDETFNLSAGNTVERTITLIEEEPSEPYLIVSQADSIISFSGTEASKIKYVRVWVPVEEQGDGNWWTAEWIEVHNNKVSVAGMGKRYVMTLYTEQNNNSNWHGSWGRVEAISPVEKFYYETDKTWNLKFQPEI